MQKLQINVSDIHCCLSVPNRQAFSVHFLTAANTIKICLSGTDHQLLPVVLHFCRNTLEKRLLCLSNTYLATFLIQRVNIKYPTRALIKITLFPRTMWWNSRWLSLQLEQRVNHQKIKQCYLNLHYKLSNHIDIAVVNASFLTTAFVSHLIAPCRDQ